MQSKPVRIIQFQTAVVPLTSIAVGRDLDDDLSFRRACELEREIAEELLAKALTEDFDISNVTISAGAQTFLTVYTLRPVVRVTFDEDALLYRGPFDQHVNRLIENGIRQVTEGANRSAP